MSRDIPHYNLDAILSVGYRVKSRVATQFRVWATARLRDYLVQGYAINEHRLEQLGSIVRILSRSRDELVAGVADVLSGYVPGLTLLRDYDEGNLDAHPTAVPGWELTIDEARAVIARVAAEFPGDTLIGKERGGALAGVVATIYQGFGGKDLYPTVEEKAAPDHRPRHRLKPSLRNKKDLIEAFVQDLSAEGEIDAEWRAFVAARRAAELEAIIEAEGLRPEETRAFVETGFRDGMLRTTGTAITKVLPPVSRFAAGGGHADKKQRVIARLGEFFERFLGLA